MAQHKNAVFFCHGAPGSPQDATLLPALPADTLLIAHDILAAPPQTMLAAAIEAFESAADRFAGGKITIAGFSIGAMLALKLAAARPDATSGLILISAAAPLSLGNFLPHMAGKPVFELAADHPGKLRTLTRIQCLLSRVTPKLLRNQLFHKSGSPERALLQNKAICAVLQAGFRNSFCSHPDAYIALLQSYVCDWSAEIAQVTCPVTLWHGEHDTWSPPAMARAIQAALPKPAALHIVPKAGHYSTLTSVSLTAI